jgi:murein DD-endopeptidase MepM/ murein hydrolase activator NlpD
LAASSNLLLPDSEVINSPGSKNFDTAAFVTFQGGFLTQYRELVAGTWLSGAEIVERVALNHSINPRLLLAILEYRSGWVSDPRRPIGDDFYFPIRTANRIHQGLHIQLSWVANVLSRGYYGWHENVTDIGESEPRVTVANPGTAALRQFLEEVCSSSDCEFDLMDTYRQLFGDPLEKMVDLNLEDLDQPDLILPFPGTNQWILTGGPHGAWGPDSPWAALDFAPKWDPLRRTSDMEVVAVADGVVARLDHGILVLDLDGDEYEQTGWSILYLHLVALEGIAQGDSVLQGQIIGEASSAGGVAGGDHIHLARKYDGVWIPASGPVPFKLGTWRVRTGAEAYEGELFQPARGCEDVEFSVPVGGSLRPAPVWDCRGYILN